MKRICDVGDTKNNNNKLVYSVVVKTVEWCTFVYTVSLEKPVLIGKPTSFTLGNQLRSRSDVFHFIFQRSTRHLSGQT